MHNKKLNDLFLINSIIWIKSGEELSRTQVKFQMLRKSYLPYENRAVDDDVLQCNLVIETKNFNLDYNEKQIRNLFTEQLE